MTAGCASAPSSRRAEYTHDSAVDRILGMEEEKRRVQGPLQQTQTSTQFLIFWQKWHF